jgi:hypothetical protein
MPEWLHLRPEVVLFAVAITLYLHNQAARLFANEILFYRSGGGAWTARTADRYPEFGRRYLAVLRPWRPGTIIVSATWPREFDKDPDRSRLLSEAIGDVEARLLFLRYQSTPLFVTLFVALPCAWIFYGPAALLLGILVAYLQTLVMVGSLLARRRMLGLPWRSIAYIVFESLICIPYAVNLYRKIADRLVPMDADPINLATALLSTGESTALREELLQSIDRRIGLLKPGEAKQDRLEKYRERLLEQGPA